MKLPKYLLVPIAGLFVGIFLCVIENPIVLSIGLIILLLSISILIIAGLSVEGKFGIICGILLSFGIITLFAWFLMGVVPIFPYNQTVHDYVLPWFFAPLLIAGGGGAAIKGIIIIFF